MLATHVHSRERACRMATLDILPEVFRLSPTACIEVHLGHFQTRLVRIDARDDVIVLSALEWVTLTTLCAQRLDSMIEDGYDGTITVRGRGRHDDIALLYSSHKGTVCISVLKQDTTEKLTLFVGEWVRLISHRANVRVVHERMDAFGTTRGVTRATSITTPRGPARALYGWTLKGAVPERTSGYVYTSSVACRDSLQIEHDRAILTHSAEAVLVTASIERTVIGDPSMAEIVGRIIAWLSELKVKQLSEERCRACHMELGGQRDHMDPGSCLADVYTNAVRYSREMRPDTPLIMNVYRELMQIVNKDRLPEIRDQILCPAMTDFALEMYRHVEEDVTESRCKKWDDLMKVALFNTGMHV